MKFSGDLLLVCPKHSQSPEISNEFDQQNAVCWDHGSDWDENAEIPQLSLAKAKGMQKDNSRLCLTNVPLFYIAHFVLFYREQKR